MTLPLTALQLLVFNLFKLPAQVGMLLAVLCGLRYLPLSRAAWWVVFGMVFTGVAIALDSRGVPDWWGAYLVGWPSLFCALLPNRVPRFLRLPLVTLMLALCWWTSSLYYYDLPWLVDPLALLTLLQVKANRFSRLAGSAALALWSGPLLEVLLDLISPAGCGNARLLQVLTWAQLSAAVLLQLLLRRVEHPGPAQRRWLKLESKFTTETTEGLATV